MLAQWAGAARETVDFDRRFGASQKWERASSVRRYRSTPNIPVIRGFDLRQPGAMDADIAGTAEGQIAKGIVITFELLSKLGATVLFPLRERF
jgi:hypothetical protein